LLKLLLERLSLWKSNPLILLKTSRPRSKTKKEFPPINKDLFLQENNWKTEEPYLTTIFKRNQLSIWSLDWEEECKFLSKLLLEKLSLWKSNPLIQLKTSRLKFKIRKEFPPINKDLFLPENNWKTEEPYLTTIFKRNQLSTWSLDWEEETE
jgi:hypothetical protein